MAPPHLYTIAADRPFLATLARGLIALAGGDPLALPRMTVLLPTRRAARALREAFLRLTAEGDEPGAPLLLPRLRPIGDLDEDDVGLSQADGDGETLAVPPALPELHRRLLLTRLVLAWSGRSGDGPLLPGQAAALAAALARLLDAAESEEASFATLRELAPDDLAEHWQAVLRFLDILPNLWPAVLAAEGAIDPAERRSRLLRRQAESWRRRPPAGPVIAAGLSGGIPALTELLSTVAWLDQGAVVLAGLDRSCDAAAWEAITEEPTHPQHLTAVLLHALNVARDDVPDWAPDGAPGPPGARTRRLHVVGEALLPAGMTDSWRQLPPAAGDALAGVARYDCAGPQDEAATIALLLRQALDTPAATAALVTPDRELARRVAAELRRWDIEIDDSAGVPLGRAPPGVLLRLVLDLADSALAPVPLLAALKHPLAAGGLAPAVFRDLGRQLETAIRGPRPAPGFAGLRAALADANATLRGFVDRLESCLGVLAAQLEREEAPLAELAAAHIAAAERLAATDSESGVARLWREAAGEAAAHFCHELIDAAADFPPIAGRHYPALFETLASGVVVRPAYGRHPRLAIWGLVEARLQQADLVVLGSLNEGTWPGPAAHDPWMSRQMRQAFGIAMPERTIGIAAHDFAQAFGAPRVALTRAARSEGVPTVPSRWLLRLDTVLQAVGLDGALAGDREVVAAAALRDQAECRRPSLPPRPCPPLAARPRKLAVTQIETWIRDPYAIYAAHILKLHALKDLDVDPGRADLGNIVHHALARFVERHPHGPATSMEAQAELIAIGRECFGPILSRPGVWAFWWPRFERIARWFVAEGIASRPKVAESRSEQRGQLVVSGPAGPFTITAIADRLDRLTAGGLALIDYKTGALPQKREIEQAVAVQLPLEGAIARDGSFEGLSGEPAALEYWRLPGGDPAGIRTAIAEDDPLGLVDKALARVTALIERFDNPATPYPAVPVPRWKPRFSDYFDLERVNEIAPEPEPESDE